MKLFVRSSGARRKSIKLGDRIGGGGAGDVYKIKGRAGEVAKIYRTRPIRKAYEKKVEAMTAAPVSLPPLKKASRVLHQLAWPLQVLEDRQGDFQGFSMPEIDFKAALSLERLLQKRSRAKSGLPEAYHHRVVVAYNAAALLVRLHEQGQHIVDMKPVNMLFYRETMQLALVDCDGFSILGPDGTRHPAKQFTPEYIAPEFVKATPSDLGEEQDRFSLAVIVFRLLNNGLHPYQGMPAGGASASTLAENVASGLYAYGLTPSSRITPALATIHTSFPQELRESFDRAFGKPGARPSAADWVGILRTYAVPGPGGLQACPRNSKDHTHFGEGCGWCDLEARLSRPFKVRPASGASSSAVSTSSGPAASASTAVPLAGLVRAQGKLWFLAALFAFVLSFGWGEMADESFRARPNTASYFPLSEIEERCVEMNVDAGKMAAGPAAEYCYRYYADHRTPATRQIEQLLAARGLDDISVRQRGGGLRASGTLARRRDYAALQEVLNAAWWSHFACEKTGKIEVRCDTAP